VQRSILVEVTSGTFSKSRRVAEPEERPELSQ